MEALHATTVVDTVARRAHAARPDAPIVPEPERDRVARPWAGRPRHRVSLALRRLADRLEPAPTRRTTLPGGAC